MSETLDYVTRAKIVVGSRLDAAITYAHGLAALAQPPPPGPRFVVFGQGRSGSQLLCSMLGAHPAVHADMEILFYPRHFPLIYTFGRSHRAERPAYGFKVKVYQLTDREDAAYPRRYLETLLRRGWKLIFLHRRDFVAQAVSGRVASASGRWHKTAGDEDRRRKVPVDPARLARDLAFRERMTALERRVLDGLPYEPVTYEDDLREPGPQSATVARLFEYIGVEPRPVEAPLRRTSGAHWSDRVANANELERYFRDTTYAEHFTGISDA